MFDWDEGWNDAPQADTQQSADLTDIYLYDPSSELDTDETASDDFDALYATINAEDTAANATSTVSVEFDTNDVFVFATGGAGTGSAVPDSSTPAPEEEEQGPPEFGIEWEMQNLTSARHTATGAILRSILLGDL